jgi:hypothetical protein
MKVFQKSLVSALSLTAIVALTAPCFAAEITSDVVPPPARIERFEPRDGYVWASGYWEWNGRSYHWVSGAYMPERRGARWVPDEWEQVGPHWRRVAGHWAHLSGG